MARIKKKSDSVVQIDWDAVRETIKQPDSIKMSTIHTEMGYKPVNRDEFVKCYQHNPHQQRYREYLQWLRDENVDMKIFEYHRLLK